MGRAGSPIASSAAAPRIESSKRVGHFVLHAQHPQRGAALAGAQERRADGVVGGLFDQGRGVRDHHVLTAGLGDERHDGAVGLAGQGGLNASRGVGAAGERHAGDSRVIDQRRAHVPGARHQPAARPRERRRHAAGPRPSSRCAGVCSAGLASTALPASRAADTWPRKIASGKFQGLMHTNTPRPCRLRSLDSPVGPSCAMGDSKSRSAWQA